MSAEVKTKDAAVEASGPARAGTLTLLVRTLRALPLCIRVFGLLSKGFLLRLMGRLSGRPGARAQEQARLAERAEALRLELVALGVAPRKPPSRGVRIVLGFVLVAALCGLVVGVRKVVLGVEQLWALTHPTPIEQFKKVIADQQRFAADYAKLDPALRTKMARPGSPLKAERELPRGAYRLSVDLSRQPSNACFDVLHSRLVFENVACTFEDDPPQATFHELEEAYAKQVQGELEATGAKVDVSSEAR
ncbi:MAG: hypothetical protein M5U26_03960 [Planctomycetota bacterium]|nr:hypothetical protein [Planctomycetota bacterium]